MKTGRFFVGLLTLVIIITIQCAKVVAPPGGPEDKTGASVFYTSPDNQSVNVDPGDRIAIEFSEKVDKNSVPGSIFISPRQTEEPKFKWKGRQLFIILPDSFKTSTTYIVNVGSNIKDLHNNTMDSSVIFAFSTGEKIDRGAVQGNVFKDGKPFGGAVVALYDNIGTDTTVDFDSLYAPYMTQSAKDGSFMLDYLPAGDYLLLAYEDRNKNQLLNQKKENFAVPDRRTRLNDSLDTDEINFIMQSPADTGFINIISAGITANGLIKLRMSKEVTIKNIHENLDSVFLYDVANNRTITASGIKEIDQDRSKSINLYFKDLPESNVEVKIASSILSEPNDTIPFIVSPEFLIEPTDDREPPQIVDISHENKTVFPDNNTIKLTFSEPIEFAPGEDSSVAVPILMIDQDSNIVNFNYNWSDPFVLDLTIGQLGWGEKIETNVAANRLVDLAGNAVGDSLETFTFGTYFEDSLGSISGNIRIALDETTIPYLIFMDTRGNEIINRRFDLGSFSITMPPGKYLLSGYLDRNANGIHDVGSLNPFEFSEPIMNYPDTIRVRSRFETAGIEVRFK